MKRKAIKIDWGELENAFNNSNEELIYYLDLVTGQVVLEGEGEDEQFDDVVEGYEHGAAGPEGPRPDSTRIYVPAPDLEQKMEWLRAFMDDTAGLDGRFLAALNDALEADDPAAAIQDALRAHPEGRGQWYLYRAERLRDEIDEWLETNAVHPIDPPPWR
ncbi:MAG TPA: UPF0158 family protein [Candidatus Polarisedimenticolaceae bacterium]|nr:UPF0158 family protein [Candidatus Polarisedimenticolaceae bacterium]